MRCASVILFCAILVRVACAAEDVPRRALELFAEAYDLGTAAVKERNWADANLYFATALKALGDNDHPKKDVAEILLRKGREQVQGEREHETAEELFRLRQWKEAEEAYARAAKWSGMTPEIQRGISESRRAARDDAGVPHIVTQRNRALAESQTFTLKAQIAIMDRDFKAAAQCCDELVRIHRMHGIGDEAYVEKLRAEIKRLDNEKKEVQAERKVRDDF